MHFVTSKDLSTQAEQLMKIFESIVKEIRQSESVVTDEQKSHELMFKTADQKLSNFLKIYTSLTDEHVFIKHAQELIEGLLFTMMVHQSTKLKES